MTQIFRLFAVTVVVSAGMLAQTSCSDADSCDEPALPGTGGGDVWLSFDIRNHAALQRDRTRADGAPADGDNHPDESAIPAENYINVQDLSVMLFNSDSELVRTFSSNEFSITSESTGDDASYDTYRLTVKADSSIFNFGGDVSKDFTIMVVANMNGTGTGDGLFGHAGLFNTMSELSGLYKGFPYDVEDGSQPWMPSIPGLRLIPMAGTATSGISAAQLAAATSADKALQLPDIYLQRAMAQVRLIDAISDAAYTITEVKLRGFNTRGAYLPELEEGADWSKNTAVLEYGTALPEWYDATSLLTPRQFTFTDNYGFVDTTRGSYPAYGFYVPEFDWSRLGTNPGPELQITVHDANENRDFYYIYHFPRLTVNGAQADFARNHIYQVVVTGVLTTWPVTLNISYGVCPWVEETITIPPFN